MNCLKQIKGYYMLFVIQLLWSSDLVGQSYFIDKSYNNLDWGKFVRQVELHFPLHFYYSQDSIPSFNILIAEDSLPLEIVLKNNLNPLLLYSIIDKAGNIIITRQKPIQTALAKTFFSAQDKINSQSEPAASLNKSNYLTTDNHLSLKKIVVGSKKNGAYKKDAVMSGHITKGANGEKLVGALLVIEELKMSSNTDTAGFYSIQLPRGTYTLHLKNAGSVDKTYKLEVYADDKINFSLNDKINDLNEVDIIADGSNAIEKPTMGHEKLSSKDIKYLPKMMGENDMLKTTLLLPGVQSVGEGTAGFNVRGSPADQNVFYLNQVPVYNPNHLLGFFSAFTPNAISDLNLYKGSFPAQFGGRISSIFDLTAKQGDTKKFSLQGGMSPVTANVVAEGPLVKGKSSFLVGARSTYSSWVLNLINVDAIKNSKARFDDIITNFSFRLNDKNKINVLTYYSYDNIKLNTLTAYTYQNMGASIKLSHYIKNKHVLEFSSIYSKYGYKENNTASEKAAYKLNYELNHLEAKTNFLFVPNRRHHLNLGANSILYVLNQGNYLPLNSNSFIKPLLLGKEQALESGIYANEEWEVFSHFTISAGARYNLYTYLGPKTSYTYGAGLPLELENIQDTVYYPKNAKIKSYSAPDLRLSARYSINETSSIKAGFNQAHQYIFMLSNTIALSPTDKWKLADNHIQPMNGKQYSIGFFKNLFKKSLEFSTELYYKQVQHLVEYKDGANIIVNPVPETDVLQGNLKAYGAELMLKKQKGALNGWINYTYSRAIVAVNGVSPEEKINFGIPYPANYDKPHALNIVANYKFSRRLNISTNLVYATGRPITFPTAIYYLNGMPVTHYSKRNEYRIPDYFRIDLALNYEGNLKSKKALHDSWSISVYNLLGRQNPYSIYFKQEGNQIKGYQLSIFGSPILSLSYNLKLGSYEN